MGGNGMKRRAYRYSIVRFLPYQETGEFANVGVVLACPETGYFGFKLQSRRYSRITDFFAELDSKVYLESIKLFRSELERMQRHLKQSGVDAERMRELFGALTHPREAIVKLTEARPRLSAEEPEKTLDLLYRYYVEREFATSEYRDTVVLRRVKAVVDSLKLEQPFKATTLGDDFISAHFPLVQFANEQTVAKVIKPFALNHGEPSRIFQHGAAWLDRVKRLRRKGLVPDHVLFAVDGPSSSAGDKCLVAFKDICEELREEVEVVASSDKAQIAAFAGASIICAA